MTTAIRKLVQSTRSQFGYQLVCCGKGHKAPPSNLDAFFAAVKSLGFKPTHILDVGANRAQWTRTALNSPLTKSALDEGGIV